MTSHTPGPWFVTESERGVLQVETGTYFIGRTFGGLPTEEERANARLFAAAPDLLAACEAAERRLEALAFERGHRPHEFAEYTLLVNAVDKARGGREGIEREVMSGD